jgi:predicted phosphate transport protein (TIGR00153 family)
MDRRPGRERAMFGRLMPREAHFFQLFNEQASLVVDGSRELCGMLVTGDRLQQHAYNIESIEKRADKVARSGIELLHRTFITPLDREEIHQLITRMDDILDIIEDTAHLLFLYHVKDVTAETRQLADINHACTQKVQAVVGMLSDMKNANAMLAACDEIDRYESEADHVMRSAIARLFREEADVRELIKMRTVYEHLEAVTDACEDVANIIEGIVLENS